MPQEKLLHLGCGEFAGAHWRNVDSSPNVILDNHPVLRTVLKPILHASSRNMKFKGVEAVDLRRRWPYETGFFDAIYSSHFFEHLPFKDGQHVLRECFRVLKPGGKIRFLVPSIENEVEQYLQFKKAGNPLASTEFAKTTNVFPEPPTGSWWYRLFFSFYDKNSHKMFYDADSLAYYFAQVGFDNVKGKPYLESEIPYLEEVEKPDRFKDAACIEARRPS